MEIHRVPASHGWLWVKHAYRLIMRSPLQAFSMTMAFAFFLFLARLIPLVGPLLALLMMPVLMAGYVRGCRALEFSETVEPRFIIAGFENRATQLASLGALLLLGIVIVSIVTTELGGSAMYAILETFKNQKNPNELITAMLAPGSGVRLALFAGFSLLFALMLAMQFAPMLVYFNKLTPLQALKASLFASVRNIIPFSVYSLIMQVIAFVLSPIPFGLGWMILLPIGLTSMYVAYRDIFAEPEESTVKEAE